MYGDHHVYAVAVDPVEEPGEQFPLRLVKGVYIDADVVVDASVVLARREQLHALYQQSVFYLLFELTLNLGELVYAEITIGGGVVLYLAVEKLPDFGEFVGIESIADVVCIEHGVALEAYGHVFRPRVVYVGKEPSTLVAELEKDALIIDTDRVVDDEQRIDTHQVVDDGLVDPGFFCSAEKREHVASFLPYIGQGGRDVKH